MLFSSLMRVLELGFLVRLQYRILNNKLSISEYEFLVLELVHQVTIEWMDVIKLRKSNDDSTQFLTGLVANPQ